MDFQKFIKQVLPVLVAIASWELFLRDLINRNA